MEGRMPDMDKLSSPKDFPPTYLARLSQVRRELRAFLHSDEAQILPIEVLGLLTGWRDLLEPDEGDGINAWPCLADALSANS
mgnify:CR=1 FL=1